MSAGERVDGFTLGFWDGSYPDEDIDAIARLQDVMNSAPRDSLDMEDMHFTPDQLRQMEQMFAASGIIRLTAYVREQATGAFAGFTEVLVRPNRPTIIDQGGTGVFPEYRGHGLGRRLKAAMLDRIAREHPEARFIRTGNADSNAPMLKINTELGFKPYSADVVWQVPVAKARAYLEGRRT
jgi:GNAT superfamily N-acetyltransferase